MPHDGNHQDFLHLGHTGALAESAGNLGNHTAAGLLVADPLLGSKETFDSKLHWEVVVGSKMQDSCLYCPLDAKPPAGPLP